MRVLHRWIPEHQLVLVHHEGSFDIPALLAGDEAAFQATTGRDVRFLGDHRASRLDFGVKDVEAFARGIRDLRLPASHPGLRAAMVVEDRVATALGLLFRSFVAADLRFDVFSTVAGACGFLGVDPAVVEAHADLVPPD